MNLQCIFTGWKTLLCLWLFRIRSWNACFCGFLNAGLQNDGRLLTSYKCACSTFIFKHRAFPSSVTTPSTGTITPCSILHPPLTKNTPRVLIGWNLSHHKTHHWRRSFKTCALIHIKNQCRCCEVTTEQLWVIHQLTKASTAALTSVYRHVTHKHTSDIVLLCIYTWVYLSFLLQFAAFVAWAPTSAASWPSRVRLI